MNKQKVKYMKKKLLLITLPVISFINSYSQISFEKGYFIDESDQRYECLIKSTDWRNNPTEFKYKMSQNDKGITANVENVKEFGIYSVSKYIRDKVKIDRSSDQVNMMDSNKDPILNEELLFLNVLIEGEASLYLYTDNNLTRLFYKVSDSEISQLIYKRFNVNEKISTNSYFKNQIFQTLKCEEIKFRDIEDLQYSKKDLVPLFIKYNDCIQSEYMIYQSTEKEDLFSLTLRPGLNYSSLKIQNSMSNSRDFNFDENIGFRYGIEAEFTLPYNGKIWSIILEPTYQYFKSEQSKETNTVSGGILVSKVDYKSIELPVGVRYNYYIKDKLKLFTNVSIIFVLPSKSSIQFLRNDGSVLSELKAVSRINLALGIGLKYSNRYSLEMRYNKKRNILSDNNNWDSGYNSLNIVFGFSLI